MEQIIEFKTISLRDLLFVNELRNNSAQYLHNPERYTYEQTVEWFNKVNPKWYIVFINGKRIGYIRISEEDKKLFIGMDIVEEYRGKGYGEAIYKEFIPILYKIKGKIHIWLKVLKFNLRAINLYEKLGFKLIETESIIRNGMADTSLTYKLKYGSLSN